jgi:hypothetical protein
MRPADLQADHLRLLDGALLGTLGAALLRCHARGLDPELRVERLSPDHWEVILLGMKEMTTGFFTRWLLPADAEAAGVVVLIQVADSLAAVRAGVERIMRGLDDLDDDNDPSTDQGLGKIATLS